MPNERSFRPKIYAILPLIGAEIKGEKMSYISDYKHGGDEFEYEQCCADENRKDRIECKEYYREEEDEMSVSKWAWTEECDARICVGDCDLCSFAEENAEEEDE